MQEILINTLRHNKLIHSSFGHLVQENQDTLSYANSLPSFSFSHIFWQNNALTHVLVKRVRISFPVFFWMESVSPNLHDYYVMDLLAMK